MKVPARSDRARFPPLGYVTVYESNLRAGLRFPPSLELIDILTICGVSLSQFSYRAMSIVMGLIVLFRDCGVVFFAECLSRMGRLFSDVQGRISFRSKWLDIRTRDPSKGKSSAQMLKRSVKALEVVPQKNQSKIPGSSSDLQAPKKKKADEILAVTSKGPLVSPSKSYILEDVLKHQCIGHRRAEKLHLEMNKILNDWNSEFMKIKYLQGVYKKKCDRKVKEMKVNERIDHLHIELVEAQSTINQQMRDQQILEAENKKLQSMLSEKEAQQLPSTVIEEFKKSYAFKIIIEDHVQEARNHIYDVKVKALEAECTEDGFIKGFMKGVRDVQHKTGAEIEGLTHSQASGDPSSDYGGEELESDLQQAFSLEEEEDDIDIL
ncbi:hypothetical protein IEQ34_018499 [Dendrobium chrysotoxum]|uniref:Uncharacterized protein n=1 Tax=Dendrobium chrysotoxum TaxID=161865 RepID=A0AAV7FNJ8_DENCH|nr:hypothetical protein IEQ34_018499 [Dendrobium chrysotoxum]